MKIYITGISGTGKTSIARALISQGINAVDIDEISHWENKTSGETVGMEPGASDGWHKEHVWLCDLSKLKEILSRSKNAVTLGHTSNQEEYLPLFDKIFVLRCKQETIIARIQARTDNDFGKHPTDMARILSWQEPFEKEMVSKGAIVLDGEKPVDEIIKEIVLYFD